MGKNRTRVKGPKGERWARGMSSSSNPSKNKHRNAAKSRFFQFGSQETNDGGGKLTAAALMRHDAVMGETSAATEEDTVTLKMTNKTFDTFASDWSQCTNVAFEKLVSKFSASNAGQKEMLAVLAAVTEVIKSQGGKETETEYFAALMTTLEVSETEESLAAVVRLLSLVIKRIPGEVLVSRFSQVTEILLETLGRHSSSANVSLLRGLLGCLSVTLRVQPPSVWSLPATERVFQALLTYTAHSKPKIRKAGQHAVVAVVRGGSTAPNSPHPAAAAAAQHCTSLISNSAPGDNTVLYMLALLRELLPSFPKAHTKTCCETILRLMTLGSQFIVSTGLAALHGLFFARPSSFTLPADLNGQLLTALYDYKPGLNDGAPLISWLTVIQEGLLNLAQLDASICHAHLARFFTMGVASWLSDRADVVSSAGLAMKAVAGECLRGAGTETLQKIVTSVSEGLQYQYHAAWSTVLGVMGAVVDVVGADEPSLLKSVLANLSQLRGYHNFNLHAEVDAVVGRAVRVMGPKAVLEAIPLNITGEEKDYEFATSWLLPVLRDNIQNTNLAFFNEYFLPLAARCLKRSNDSEKAKDKIGHKTYEVIVYQIWSLLPGFCNNPTDLKDSFQTLARILGTELSNRKEIRLDILTSIRHLIAKNLENTVNKEELARFAKNFLPILFNLYTTTPSGSEEAGQRLAALETAKLYLKISTPDLVSVMFDRALAKFQTTDSDKFTRDAIMDLLRAFLPYLDTSRIGQLYMECLGRVGSADHKEQKKSYRMLEDLCKCESPESKKFLSESLSQLQSTLLENLSKSSPSSQAPRLRCLVSIVRQLETPNQKFVLSVIPEAVLSIRAVNTKARDAAYMLLVVVGEALQRWSEGGDMDAVYKLYVQTVMAGLAGNPGLINCTLLAITRIYFQFRDIFPEDLADLVLDNVLLLLSSPSREVAGAALSFVKVFITTCPVIKSARHVPSIVKSLCAMPESCKRAFRTKSKYLMERLVRKFSWEFISTLVPKSDTMTHKRLRNLKKELNRKARNVEEGSDVGSGDDEWKARGRQRTMEEILADSSDDEMEEDGHRGKEKKKKSKTSGTWISEGGEGIVDLLSPGAAQAVTSTHPKAGKTVGEDNKKKSSDFEIGADGKLIINESDDEDPRDRKRKSKNSMEEDDDEEEEETFEKLVSGKKRKHDRSETASQTSRMSGVSKATGATSFSHTSYKKGGSGIHRDTQAPGSEYRSKKARGDVKRKGKPDPYAYVPLSHGSLNKRKASKSAGEWSGLVNAARKGAKSGSKSRGKKQIKDVKKLMKNMKV